MDLRALPGPSSERRFGRRATDGERQARYTTAAFVAQVAGLSLPAGKPRGAYDAEGPVPPTGLVTNTKV